MALLDYGLIVFFAFHSIPFFPGFRHYLAEKMGEKIWKAGFSAVSLLSLILVGFGYAYAPYKALWSFSPVWDQVAVFAMFVAFTLIIAGTMKGHIRKFFRQPMSLGFLIWGLSHLLATGDLANVKLFGGFALYSLIALVSAEARRIRPDHEPRARDDVRALLNGAIFYAIFYFAHGWLFGAPLTS